MTDIETMPDRAEEEVLDQGPFNEGEFDYENNLPADTADENLDPEDFEDPAYLPTLEVEQPPVPEPQPEQPATANVDPAEQLRAQLEEAQRELAELRAKPPEHRSGIPTDVPKNHKAGRADTGTKYVRLGNLESWGRVPQQQADLASILVLTMKVGQPYSEADVFQMLVDHRDDFKSLRESKQHVTYLFRYYRGLEKSTKRGGFIARNFLRQVKAQ